MNFIIDDSLFALVLLGPKEYSSNIEFPIRSAHNHEVAPRYLSCHQPKECKVSNPICFVIFIDCYLISCSGMVLVIR